MSTPLSPQLEESVRLFRLKETQRIRTEAQLCVNHLLRSRNDLLPTASFRSIPRDPDQFRVDLVKSLSSSRMDGRRSPTIQLRSITPEKRAFRRQQGSVRAQAAIAASVNIRNSLRALRLQHIEDKSRRFEIRQNSRFFQDFVRQWCLLNLHFQQLNTLQTRLITRKYRKTHVKKMIGLWVKVTKIVGKVRRMVWLRKEKRALLKLIPLRPFIRRWKREKTLKYGELIFRRLTNCVYRLQISRLIHTCQSKIRKITGFLRHLIYRKNAQVQLIVLQWERFESEQIADLRKRVGRRLTLAQRVALTEVPLYMKTTQSARLRRILLLKCSKVKPFVRFSAILPHEFIVGLYQAANKNRHMWDPTVYFPRLNAR